MKDDTSPKMELAQRSQISESTLERWRAEGIGPIRTQRRRSRSIRLNP